MTPVPPVRYIVDASVSAKWFTRHAEPDRERAAALRKLHLEGRCTLAMPEFALLEIANAIRFSERAGVAEADRALEHLEKLRLEIIPMDWPLLRRAAAIAFGRQLAVYDAAYIALAERFGAPLVTADETLARRSPGPPQVVRLRDLALS